MAAAPRVVVDHGVSSFSFSQAIAAATTSPRQPSQPVKITAQLLRRLLTPPGGGHSRIERSCEQLACMVQPVTIMLVGVVAYVWALGFDPRGRSPLLEQLPYERARGDGAGAIAWGSTLNALYLMCYVARHRFHASEGFLGGGRWGTTCCIAQDKQQ